MARIADAKQVLKILETLVQTGWDFSQTAKKTGTGPITLTNLLQDPSVLKNSYFALDREDRERFKQLWDTVTPDGFVYFIKAPLSGRIKIGYSTDPFKRVSDLRTGSPEGLELIQFIPGNQKIERLLHKRFDRERIQGEWFQGTLRLYEYIESIADWGL